MLHFPSLSGSSVYNFVPSIFGDLSGTLQGILSPKLYRYKPTFRSRHSVASLHTYRHSPCNFLYTFNSLLRDVGLPIISHTQLQLLTRSLSTNQIARSPRFATAGDLIGQFFSMHTRGAHKEAIKESTVRKLEDRANDYPTDSNAQEEYLRLVLEMDPHYVIRRFETGKFAVNSSVRRLYLDALVLTGQFNNSPKNFPAIYTNIPKGTAEAPLVVQIAEKKYKKLREAGKFVLYMLIFTYFVSTLDNGFKGALPQLKKTGFSQDMGEKKYTFSDVQGAFEAKEELREVVEFLRTPEKFQRLGAKMPKGVLLVGKPGTGKTLLARAVAGEANVPFFFTSGSEFDEMYVGVGAARLRNLFQTAKSSKPCVIFIDELDAVGGARIATDVHPYARMTLNQLLVELDGYKENEEVVVIGATNFPESLDKALVRPGRFDVKINIPIPDLKARHDILKLYLEKVKVDPALNIESLARSTLGMTGADLANLVNQAAIRGSVLGREFVTREDLENAEDKIRMGPERRSLELRERNKEVIAYHEAGHALVSLYTEGSMAIRKATIIPRGGSLGMVSFFPDKDELGWTKKQMLAQLDVAMGGRAAEEIVFGEREVTAGASSDMRGATGLATTMVAHYGMSDKLGPIYIENPSKISGELRKLVDTEVRRLITEALSRAQSILHEHRNEHMYLAKALLKYETLNIEEINKVIKGEKLKRTI